jgi:ABC-type nitrate/sulfonate/bicarbonate transport system ATPase subunit
LLHLIGALDKPDGGTISLDGVNPLKLDANGLADYRNRQIGFVFQDHHLLPQLTVWENVLSPAWANGGKATREIGDRARALIERVGMGNRINHFPSQLSGGERQRVSIARALVVDPTVLLMDEPFAALDAQNRAMMQAEMIRILKEESKTVVLVTHSIEEAINLSDVIVVMTRRPGRVKEIIRVPEPRRMVEDTPAYLAIRRQIRDLIAGEHDVSEAV